MSRILLEEYEMRKERNKNYSLRAFASFLEIGSGRLSEIISGQRNVSVATARKIAAKLKLKDDEVNRWVKSLRKHKIQLRSKDVKTVSLSEVDMVSDWWFFAILSLAKTKDFKEDVDWIANRLNIKSLQVEDALQTLHAKGFLNRDSSGGVQITSPHFSTPSDILSLALQRGHKQKMMMAIEAFESVPVECRDMSSMVIAADKQKIQQAKKMITKFRRDLADFLEDGDKNEIFHLGIQLYPVSKEIKS